MKCMGLCAQQACTREQMQAQIWQAGTSPGAHLSPAVAAMTPQIAPWRSREARAAPAGVQAFKIFLCTNRCESPSACMPHVVVTDHMENTQRPNAAVKTNSSWCSTTCRKVGCGLDCPHPCRAQGVDSWRERRELGAHDSLNLQVNCHLSLKLAWQGRPPHAPTHEHAIPCLLRPTMSCSYLTQATM